MPGRIPRDLMPIVNQMTNWQRNQWAMAGYPLVTAHRFAKMKRGESVQAELRHWEIRETVLASETPTP